MVVASQSGFSRTNGYYVALLRSECTSAPLSPPAVGQTVVGPDYVMLTVAEGDPLDFGAAQRAVTDRTFASLMPKYCGLSRSMGAGCVTNRVQWNVMTYDATGNPKISGCAASGCQYHSCDVTNAPRGFYVALLRSECTSAPLSPPAVGQTVVEPDYVMMTVAEGDPLDFGAAQRAVTDRTFASLMPKYCRLSRTTGCVTDRVQWNVMTYDATGNPKISGCAASGCQYRTCDVTNVPKGFYVALLRSECTSAPLSPPAVGKTVVGPDYVMMTVAEGDPLDFGAAQRAVTDRIFASLMPKYCGLSRTTGAGCVTDRVQWNVMTYDATGNPKISGGPTSGSQYHACDVTNPQPMLASPIIAAVPTLNNGTVTMSFASEPGLHYVIEYKASVDANLWTRLDSIDGNGEVLSLRDSDAMASSRFYRIRVE